MLYKTAGIKMIYWRPMRLIHTEYPGRLQLVLTLILVPVALHASVVMYGVTGGHASTPVSPNGSLVIVDQTTGAVTTVLDQSGFPRLTGLGIEPNGTIFATTLGGVPFPPGPGQSSTSDLLRLGTNGAVLSDIGTVKDAAGDAIAIADLAVQPGTGTLFAISNEFGSVPPGDLFTINPANATATLVGATGDFFGSIAFAPDGSLYLIAAAFNNGPAAPFVLTKISPITGAPIGTPVNLSDFYGAFGIRSTDGTFFVGNGDAGQIFTLNPATGVATALPQMTGSSFVADLDFIPEPSTLLLTGLGIAALAMRGKRRRS
ncbi:MAG TPA: PEP-CTERM sorting domain-containing protein [Bryobacteraceae bacterium]|nr:PEP-CTERM sorting domain-containing protein [Bryobacteraceae bacterium]